MNKFGKTMAVLCASAVAVTAGVALAACGGGDSTKTYADSFNNIESWDGRCVGINAFGDEAGVGMINLNSWGNKKLKLGADGTCAGEGCKWTCTLSVAEDYTLSFAAHLVGDGANYSGECDFTYMFQGSFTEVDGGYKLAAPTYAKVTIEGANWKLTGDPGDFANYIPGMPDGKTSISIDSKGEGDELAKCPSATPSGSTYKVVPDKLLTTVFGGATFKVSGDKITEVTDSVLG